MPDQYGYIVRIPLLHPFMIVEPTLLKLRVKVKAVYRQALLDNVINDTQYNQLMQQLIDFVDSIVERNTLVKSDNRKIDRRPTQFAVDPRDVLQSFCSD